MNALVKRGRAEESVFANRQKEEFLAKAVGLRKLGEWAASHMMDENAPAVKTFAEALVRSGVANDAIFNNVADRINEAGVALEPAVVAGAFDEFLDEARRDRGLL